MMFKLDKTVLIVALTRFLNETNTPDFQQADFQRTLDILTGSKAHLIGQSVSVDEYDFELLEPFLDEV